MSLLATVHQSTTRWIESGLIEASAQAQNSPAASGFLPLALATKAQPPPTVTYLPPGRHRQLEDAVLEVRRALAQRRDRPDADVLDRAVARAEVRHDVPAAAAQHLPRRDSRC